jgi:pyruvate,orthophosphate dikinase
MNLAKRKKDIAEPQKEMNVSEKTLEKNEDLHEFNPMLGHRGVRLAVTYPEIYDMQAEAIIDAAIEVSKVIGGKKAKVIPEIMIPIVATTKEFSMMRERIVNIVEAKLKAAKIKLPYKMEQ